MVLSKRGDNGLVESELYERLSDNINSSEDATFSDYNSVLKDKNQRQFRTPELGDKNAKHQESKSSPY